MIHSNTKIRFDGSHWIGLYQTTSRFKRGPSRVGKTFNVSVNKDDAKLNAACMLASDSVSVLPSDKEKRFVLSENNRKETLLDNEKYLSELSSYKVTKKSLFDSLYNMERSVEKEKRSGNILEVMQPLFETKEDAQFFVDENNKRMQRNNIIRRMRFVRKCKMTKFNYFVTFTYDDTKLTEDQFRKKFLNCVRHLANRAGWKYAGVWERGAKTQRLHFHALFYIPEGTFRGELIERSTYSFKQHKRITVLENTYFRNRFGMNEFEPIDEYSYKSCINYIMKYLEKTGEKITYSRGMPLYYLCDTSSEDAVMNCKEDNPFKVILASDFVVYKQGCALGVISPDILKELQKINS